jgi:hypothetical protein
VAKRSSRRRGGSTLGPSVVTRNRGAVAQEIKGFRRRRRDKKQEVYYLRSFWSRSEHLRKNESVLDLLREYAGIRLTDVTVHRRREREKHWKLIRVGLRKRLGRGKCASCWCHEDLLWHHIIQLQHGGSNVDSNLIAICETCHAAIHPWLKAPELVVDERFRPLWG